MKKLTIVKDETCSFCELMMEYMEDIMQADQRFENVKPEFVDYSSGEAAEYENYFVPAFYIDDELIYDGPVDREEMLAILERVIGEETANTKEEKN